MSNPLDVKAGEIFQNEKSRLLFLKSFFLCFFLYRCFALIAPTGLPVGAISAVKLMVGLEPTTYALRMRRSADWATSAEISGKSAYFASLRSFQYTARSPMPEQTTRIA